MTGKLIKWDVEKLTEQVRSTCEVDHRGCWLWSYGVWATKRDHGRYPSIMIKGRSDTVARHLLKFITGEAQDVARHTCDQPWCCNPSHLIWGTAKDNTADAIKRGRFPTPKRGDDHWTKRYPERISRGKAHSEAVSRGKRK